MNDYKELRIDIPGADDDLKDYLAGLLADENYESFVPDDDGLTAYVQAELYDEEAIPRVLAMLPGDLTVSWHSKLIEGQDWNHEWEKNYFQPIVIAGQCAVHSSFHTDVPKCRYDIVIDPKMAFGTGHHATTTLILTQLLKYNLEGRSVIDMGTGTGILAILAAMRGASPVYGIEIDGFAFLNAIDNVAVNGHEEIKLINGDASALEALPQVDVFLANINRNVITADLPQYVRHLHSGGVMLLSGFYERDIPVVLAAAEPLGLKELHRYVSTEGDPWSCLELVKML